MLIKGFLVLSISFRLIARFGMVECEIAALSEVVKTAPGLCLMHDEREGEERRTEGERREEAKKEKMKLGREKSKKR